MKKINLCILFGGASSEHEVSLLSAASVLANLDSEKYCVHKLFITKAGGWFYYPGGPEGLQELGAAQDRAGLDRAMISPDRSQKAVIRFTEAGTERYPVDAVFPVLHGKCGEDGTVQGLLELAGIPCVGSGILGSAVCMDKCVAKTLLAQAGIPQADWVEMSQSHRLIEEAEARLGYPCFVKPANAGSSVGITKAHNRQELEEGIALALRHDSKVLVEEMMYGAEVESSVLGNQNPVCAAALGEIAPAAEFYDYDAKYNNAASVLTIPAELDPALAETVRSWAVKAYKACQCRGMARVDFFVDKEKGQAAVNEINTLPGFTSISMYAKLWEASGLTYGALIDRLVELAMETV